MASDPQGDTVVVWSDGSNVWEAERPAGGSWSTGSKVDTTDTGTQLLSPSDAVGISGSGEIYVFFGVGSKTVVASKAIGGSSWTLSSLESGSGVQSTPVLGAVNASGQAVAVWQVEVSPNSGAQTTVWTYATKAATSSSWSSPATIGSQGDAWGVGSSSLAIDSSGDAALAYEQTTNSGCFCDSSIQGSEETAAGSWTTPNAVSTATADGTSAVSDAIDSSGNATATWLRSNGTDTIVQYSTKALGASSWPTAPASGANDLSSSSGIASSPAVAVAPSGRTVIAWTIGSTISEVERATASGTFSTAATIPNSDSNPFGLVLTAGGDGSFDTLWGGENASSKEVVSGARQAAGATSFTALPDVPGTGNGSPTAATDNQGNVAAAWTNGGTVVQGTGLAVHAPTIAAVHFPSSASLGKAFSYSATVSERWGTATARWNFGDGTTGPLSGKKTYHKAGRFTAVLTARDGFGNKATKSVKVTVLGPPGAPTLHHTIDASKHKATFTFSATGAKSYQCSLVKIKGGKRPTPSYGACKSPKTYSGLSKASYEFFVRGVSGSGPGAAATFRFTI